MYNRKNLDVGAYLVVGPENTNGRAVEEIVGDAVRAGFTIVQIRSKVAGALEMIELCRKAADKIANLGKSDSVSLVVDDRLDVVLAARERGIKVDGIFPFESKATSLPDVVPVCAVILASTESLKFVKSDAEWV